MSEEIPAKPKVIKPKSVSLPSVHTLTMYEIGKNLYTKTIETQSAFCKFMITFSIGAIPTYVGLLKYMAVDLGVLNTIEAVIVFSPFLFFILSTITFILGHMPKIDKFNINIKEQIQKTYRNLQRIRRIYIIIGVVLFVIALALVAASVVLIVYNANPL